MGWGGGLLSNPDSETLCPVVGVHMALVPVEVTMLSLLTSFRLGLCKTDRGWLETQFFVRTFFPTRTPCQRWHLSLCPFFAKQATAGPSPLFFPNRLPQVPRRPWCTTRDAKAC